MSSSYPLNLSSDEEVTNICLPKIVDTISLQDCMSLNFDEDKEGISNSLLYPTCEIKEESDTIVKDRKPPKQNILLQEKKRIKPTQLIKIENLSSQPSTSTSKQDSRNVDDSDRLVLQENIFKTKELFDTFLRVCQDQESTDEMEKVVQKMVRTYEKTKQEFLGSLRFQNILEEETEKVNTSTSKPWLNLKLVLDEMKNNKKQSTQKLKLGDSEESQEAEEVYDEPKIECPKKRAHLKKLEKFMRALNLRIKALEEKEVDLDNENDSTYLKLDRYRAQIVKVYAKVCEIKGQLPDAERQYLRKVSFPGSTYPHINRCIERYYNKKREFPDFQDIKKLVIKANQQEDVQMTPMQVHTMAQHAFKQFGEYLKRLRQYDDYDVMISYMDHHADPARDDADLREKLDKNREIFKKKEQEVIDKFAEKDAGLESESEDSSSESRPVKKKRKIIFATSRKSDSKDKTKKKSLTDSEASDGRIAEEKESNKKKPVLSDSSFSSSEEKANDLKSTSKKVSGKLRKGKTLLSKSMKNTTKQANVFSSEEESVPINTKDAFADRLGLQSNNIKKKSEFDTDEIQCVNEIKKSPVVDKLKETVKDEKKTERNCYLLSDEDESSSGEESVVEERKNISDVELSPDSDENTTNKTKQSSLNKVPVDSVSTGKLKETSSGSDSDDILILSQETKVISEEPSKNTQVSAKKSLSSVSNRLSLKTPVKRKVVPKTSTPNRTALAASSNRTSGNFSGAVIKKQRRDSSVNKPKETSATANGLFFKKKEKRICPPPPAEETSIPLIELD